MTYQTFIFEDWQFDVASKTLSLNYSLDGQLNFIEKFRFDFEFSAYSHEALERACQDLFVMAGVSYYKAYLPAAIEVKKGSLDGAAAAFFSKTYQRGLGEFFYVNQLDPHTSINFPVAGASVTPIDLPPQDGLLVGLGGGKDSLVSLEILRTQPKVATWSVGHREQLQPLVTRIGLPHFWVERTWDSALLNENSNGAYNGHVPISAILACTGSIVALLSSYRDVVVSNESSADEQTLTYQGVAINHQYSKSSEFENDYQAHLAARLGDSVRYYSLLRPLSELRICELFSKDGLDKYKDVFSSCNRAFTHTQHQIFWCGDCPKCAFVFLALTPFVERQKLEALWHGKNLLLDPSLETTYRQLLGIEGDKPLECVGEVKESRAAMRLAQSIYSELDGYQFELPSDYDFRAQGKSSLPSEILELVKNYS